MAAARAERDASQLTESEQTIADRVDAAGSGVHAVQNRLRDVEREMHELKGALSQSEGLHQERALAAARVEHLVRHTDRETLESQAYDRLVALFEECREKQLGTVMGPIHDRVVRWMRLLGIGHHSIRFNDQFLPETLVAAGGAIELALDEESTGTIEQIGLFVRLALGSAISTADGPVVSVLDDPLTHSDTVRLELMRSVLASAAAGDSSATPPAGPLQILVFTCHPEWFVTDGAKVVDLSRPDILARHP